MLNTIERLTGVFFKLAQLQVEVTSNVKVPRDPIYRNHVIRINQQAGIIQDITNAGVQAGNTNPVVKTHVDNFRNLSIRFTGIVQGGGNLQQEQDLMKSLFAAYNTIEDNYIDYRWEPMKEIRDSLTYIARNIPEVAKEQGIS